MMQSINNNVLTKPPIKLAISIPRIKINNPKGNITFVNGNLASNFADINTTKLKCNLPKTKNLSTAMVN